MTSHRAVPERLVSMLAFAAIFFASASATKQTCGDTVLVGEAFADSIVPARGPDLGVTIFRVGKDSRSLLVTGQTATLSIAVNNLHGDSDAHNATLAISVPTELKADQARPAPDRTQTDKTGAKLIWNIGTMRAAAAAVIFELDVVTNRKIPLNTELQVTATVSTSDADASPDNDRADFVFIVAPSGTDLQVGSDLEAVPLTISHPIKFTTTVFNWGTTSSSPASLSVNLPSQVSFLESDPVPTASKQSSLSWQLGQIEPAGRRTVTITVKPDIALGTPLGPRGPTNSLKFVFDATSATSDLNPADNHLEVQKWPEREGFDAAVWISVEGADTPGELPIGKDVTYTLTYGNFGNQPAPKSSVSLRLPDGLSLVSANPAPARTTKTEQFLGGVAAWDTGDLRVGESKLIQCKVHVASVPEDGSVVMAKVSADGVDIDTRNNVAYSWRRAPQGMASHVSTGAVATPSANARHALRWIWVALLVALAAATWFVIRARRGKPFA